MPLLIDTYNVLHVVGVLPPELAGLDARGLAALLARSRYEREPVILVCDGTPPPGLPPRAAGRVELRFAGAARTADDLIIELVRRAADPRRLIVVSSDRAVRRGARRLRAKTMSSEVFLRRLTADAESRVGRPRDGGRAVHLGRDEVAGWIAEFDLEGRGWPTAEEIRAAMESKAAKPTQPATPKPKSTPKSPPPAPPREGPPIPRDVIDEAMRLWEEEA